MRYLSILCLLVSCTPTGPQNQWTEAQWPDVADDSSVADVEICIAPPVEEGWDSQNSGPLTGFFAVEAILKAKVVAFTIQTRQYLLLRLNQEGTNVRQKVTVCDLRLPSFEGLVDLRIPPAAQALIQSKAAVVEGEFLAAEEVGAAYTTGPQMVMVGAEIAGDPVTGELPGPESPSCPADGESCTVDEDCDGFPGVTMEADVLLCEEGTEQLHIALRTIVDLHGIVGEGFNSLEGTVSPVLQWSVLGASHECLDIASSIELEIIDGTPFKAIRVDGRNGSPINLDKDGDGLVDCAEVNAAMEKELVDWTTPLSGE
ncbi:MAG TPA: hypothetical protein EYN06_02640 [Myxococcales bacterium]|nr:hypothetical protein [Myxococcales bacterium]HIN85351.1 hypothetical protein [Myxococcales bacterium]